MSGRFLALAIVSAITACASNATRSDRDRIHPVTWHSLTENSVQLNDQRIKICGWFRSEFELCTLQQDVFSDPALATASSIWIAPASDVCELEKVIVQPSKGWAEISGVFHRSDDPSIGFGHLGQYRSAISDARITTVTACDSN